MFFKKLIFYSALLLTMFLFETVPAQESNTLSLSLNEALNLAKENNFELNIARQEVNQMSAEKNKTLSVFLPQISVSETFIKTDDPINVFAFKLKQKIISKADFNPYVLNNPANTYNYNTKLEIKQPLINFDGFFGRAAAADGLSALQFKKLRTEHYTAFLTKITYFQLVLQKKSLKVLNEALIAAKANRKLIKDYFDEGLITKADFYLGEIYVSNLESKLVESQNNLNAVNNKLRLILGISDNVTIEPIDSLTLNEVSFPDYNLKLLVENRSDLQSYSNRISALNNLKKMNLTKFLPKLNAFGSFEYNDTKAFGSQADNWTIGLNLQWNLFNGFQNIAEIQKSEAELEQAELEYKKAKLQGENDIADALKDLNAAKAKLNLASSVVKQAKESLKIIKDRYEKGMEKTTDLLNAETNYSNAQLNYLSALFAYNVSTFKIELMSEKQLELK